MLPIAPPGKIVCVGLNYRDHAQEQGVELPTRPLLFAKWPNALVGPGEAIVLPPISRQVDYEAELGVVIGERSRRVPAEDALSTCRRLRLRQRRDRARPPVRRRPVDAREVARHVLPGRPAHLRPREIAGPAGAAHPLRAQRRGDAGLLDRRDGLRRRRARSRSCSQAVTLEPGDLIATGTPAGVGVFRDPKVFLAAGDEVTVEIETLGELTNPVR